MTPTPAQSKAKELVEEYSILLLDCDCYVRRAARQCALKAVDKIISLKCWWKKRFWNEVKQEIQNL